MRKLLSNPEAEYLGLQLNKPVKGSNKGRYTVTKQQFEQVLELRNNGVISACNNVGVDPKNAPMLWLKNKNESVRITNPLYESPLERSYKDLKEDLIAEMQSYSPQYPKIKRNPTKDGHLLVIDIADLHINKFCEKFMTGDDYNSSIAVERAISGTKGLIEKSKGFNIDKILFVIGNDVLNTDNILKSTTKGTIQDTDTHWFKAFKIAKDCYVKCIELCLSVADVDVIHCPSNHDLVSGCFLADTVETWFRNCKNTTFDTSPSYRKYYQYYSNLIELEHGDKGKVTNLPLVIAQSQPQMWANTKYRYGYLHHVHHSDVTKYQSGKDYIGINITYLRSPSSADIWHADNSYFNMIAVEGFIHSKEHGRVSHLTHYF